MVKGSRKHACFGAADLQFLGNCPRKCPCRLAAASEPGMGNRSKEQIIMPRRQRPSDRASCVRGTLEISRRQVVCVGLPLSTRPGIGGAPSVRGQAEGVPAPRTHETNQRGNGDGDTCARFERSKCRPSAMLAAGLSSPGTNRTRPARRWPAARRQPPASPPGTAAKGPLSTDPQWGGAGKRWGRSGGAGAPGTARPPIAGAQRRASKPLVGRKTRKFAKTLRDACAFLCHFALDPTLVP